MNNHRLPTPIAIDGPAASGKSTLGRELARQLGYRFLDTGLMYRAFTLAALRAGIPHEDAQGCGELAKRIDIRVEADEETRIHLGDEDVTGLLREPAVEANVSKYSAIPAVRTRMVEMQREVAAAGLVVLAGRDIGTVVLPGAPLKLYLDASEEARAKRRGEQVSQKAQDARRDITGRDTADSARATSPLRPAGDAVVIDTTEMTLDQVIDLALEKVRCAAG